MHSILGMSNDKMLIVDIVQVVDFEKGDLLAQHHFGLAERIDNRLKVVVTLEL